jgi:hypothetical protein
MLLMAALLPEAIEFGSFMLTGYASGNSTGIIPSFAVKAAAWLGERHYVSNTILIVLEALNSHSYVSNGWRIGVVTIQ